MLVSYLAATSSHPATELDAALSTVGLTIRRDSASAPAPSPRASTSSETPSKTPPGGIATIDLGYMLSSPRMN
jgi:hypothetical protein